VASTANAEAEAMFRANRQRK